MGRIFERFRNVRFYNEAEVSQNFVIPPLTEFLGYDESEILPEHLQPAVEIPRNRKKTLSGDDAKIKPDYMVAIDGDHDQIGFSFESKAPTESLDDYLNQLLAYSISVGNLVAATNGCEFRVYDARELVFKAVDIPSLDLQFSELRKLLHKEVAHHSVAERIRSLDDDLAFGRSLDFITNEKRKQIALRNSDFLLYLETISKTSAELTLPPTISEAFQTPLKRLSAQQLYTFSPLKSEMDLKPDNPRSYSHIIRELDKSPLLIIGESGIGKTSLLTQIACDRASQCLQSASDLIPILIRLGHYTNTNNLRQLISDGFLGKGVSISVHLTFAQKRKRSRWCRLRYGVALFDETAVPDVGQQLGARIANTNQVAQTSDG